MITFVITFVINFGSILPARVQTRSTPLNISITNIPFHPNLDYDPRGSKKLGFEQFLNAKK